MFNKNIIDFFFKAIIIYFILASRMNSVYFCGPLQRVNSLFHEAHQQMAQQYQLHTASSPASTQTFTVAERLAGEGPLNFWGSKYELSRLQEKCIICKIVTS